MGDTQPVNILFVDDRPENLTALETLLVSKCRVLFKAHSADEALALVAKHQFAMIFLDMGALDDSGYNLAGIIRNNPKTAFVPIIFLAPDNTQDLKIFEGFEAGPVDCLFKPVHPNLLESKVQTFQVLSQKEHQARLAEKKLAEAQTALTMITRTDGLTGIANRRYFDEVLEKEWRRAIRKSNRLSLIMADIDYFKPYNESYGHWQGDVCLQRIAKALSGSVNRPVDLVARYGGEEFVALLPETDSKGVVHLANKMKSAVEGLAIEHTSSRVSANITISLGAATLTPGQEQNPHELVTQAERALYVAKMGGRNRVSAALPASD